MSAVEDKLADLGLTLPPVAAPLAAYVPAVRTGAYIYTSGQLPLVEGKLPLTGKVGMRKPIGSAMEDARTRSQSPASLS